MFGLETMLGLGKLQNNICSWKFGSWEKILNTCLNDSPSVIEWKESGVLKNSSKAAIKKKFSDFNTLFLEMTTLQQKLKMADNDILKSIHADNRKRILPKYKSFLDRYEKLDFSTNSFHYIKYTLNDVDHMLGTYFAK